MDEIWERAVETALDGHTDRTAARTLTLDGAVKCVQGRLPPPSLLEKFENLQLLSIANISVSSLEQFPRLRNLQKLILSDNRISGGLEFLVEAGLDSLRDLDLSNNRIQFIEDLAPLAQLKLVSLDLYECPVTRVKDYRSRVFGLIKSLKYLDKMDAEGNERPESDEEEEDEEEEDEDEDDPGSGEIDGEDRLCRMNNGHSKEEEGIADVDEDEGEESDADVEETEIGRRINGKNHAANGFHIGQVGRCDDDDDDDIDDDENVSDEEVDDDDDDEEEEEEDIVEAHEIGGSDDEEDGVEDDEEEEVDNDEMDFAEPVSTGGLTSTEGEIDGHEHGEDDGDGDDDDGETGEEEEQGVENDDEFEDEEEGEEEDDDYGEGYLVQPVGQAEEHDAGGSDMEPVNEEADEEEEEEVEDDEDVLPSSSQLKRKRSGDAEEDVDDDDEEEEEEEEEDDDDDVEFTKSSKKHG
ncbi:hypothetical protein V6N11_041035 [Hibiscus sabdariffa]|uniref:Acidic leucine-rich nuclear phosphoprotein 32-related protein n=1 Tax=Hibiscus sabdariffa TaxID=183260 RepID=A0ABR2RJX1_9ROSI